MSMVPLPIANPTPESDLPQPDLRGRFAPSPTGDLHFGSLVAALGSWLRARSQDSAWVVRIEDIDAARAVNGADQRILAALAAFGLESDEPVIWQSKRLALYQSAFDTLKARSAIYPCYCKRSDLLALNGIHPASCVQTRMDGMPAWRVRTSNVAIEFMDRVYGKIAQRLDREVGDFVIRRADGMFTYQLAVVVDDADQGISEVVRGADLLDSTPRQIHLQRLLDLPLPSYLHLPLAIDGSGRKLSKHDSARPIDASDPVPGLQAALAFLGQDVPSAKRVDDLLRQGICQFNAGAIPDRRHAHAAMQKD
jgi:glutamyl-Q tRNA(Asp) synthetase